ncbi:MAG: FAD-binding protein, partial [Actinomycetota bacterium]
MDLSVGTGPIAPVGSRTQWEIGGPAPVGATEVRAPVGITEWEPADLTVTVGAGTPFTELDAELAERGQEVPLDPVETQATVGGILACGLSGPRRLRLGPVRDHVLQVWIRTADGRLVRGGGPTVKNVTGYDLPRLAVGSFGTLGLIERVTLRCRPRPASSAWFATANGAACYRPSARLTEGEGESVLLEGLAVDIEDQARALRLRPIPGPPDRPRGH